MELDRLSARIRPRTPWEGIDLGFALGRHWFPTLWGLWCISALPVGALAAIWLRDRPDLWVLLIWWLKPVYEAPLLFWLSRALFGQSLGPRELWRERARILPARLLPNLLWRRFHPSRSFQLSLILLEGLRGPELRRRQRVLQGGTGTASWLTVICVHLESILWSSGLVLILILVPDELPGLDLDAALFDIDSTPYWVSSALAWLAMSTIAPFYIASGFAYYLTRRTELEAWDLELLFQRARDENGSGRCGPAAAAVSAALLVLVTGLPPPGAAHAASPEPDQARDLIAEVLATEDFGSRREIKTWVYVGEPEEHSGESRLPGWIRNLLQLLADGATLTAIPVKWTLIILAAAAAALVLRRILLDLRDRSGPTNAPPSPSESIRVDIRAVAELPADIPVKVRDLIARAELREALALLYRASLDRLVRSHGLAVPESATESECLALAERVRPPEETAPLRRLTGCWERLAYGHRSPDGREISELLDDWESREGRRDDG